MRVWSNGNVKFKGPPRQIDPEDVERDDVRLRVNRCPFCHDEVSKEASVVCQGCLGRQHAECWEEAGSCSACGGSTRMVAEQEASGDWEANASEDQKRRVRGLQRLILAWQGLHDRHPVWSAGLEIATLASILWVNEWAVNWLSACVLFVMALSVTGAVISVRKTSGPGTSEPEKDQLPG